MKKRNVKTVMLNYQAGQSAENGLNPSPLTPLPQGERGNKGFALAERICRGRLNPSPLAGETSPHFPSPHCGRGAGVRGNKAFTLAEVLITLVIIGVIGALTVPALIQNTQKQEYVSALKKAYSTLSQVTQQIIAEEGSPKGEESWLDGIDSLYDAYKKHLNTAKECTSRAQCMPPQGGYWVRNGQGTKWLDTSWAAAGGIKALILADGAVVFFQYFGNSCSSNGGGYSGDDACARMQIDVNGMKGPNEHGRDVFWFLLKENGLYPASCDNNGEDICSSFSALCTCKVLTEGAMNY